ncbi:hypothetical protein H2200_003242 [Cladophialophora chaetospira]|uniref:Uncharacterized protein n=1 Tax=Cladophialophora chaetospira TaxID=386627 RepID=A0AA38XGZ8_9EURO|nr:hypothetical protein H2200_003242 [Cladophialophora chaetospira]
MPSTPLGPDMASSFVNAMQQTFALAANEWEFKNGAFKNKITTSTSALEAVELMLASELTSADEKRVLEKSRQAASFPFLPNCPLLNVASTMVQANGGPQIRTALIRGSHMTMNETLMLGAETMGITNIFEEDRKKQGQYVPPMLTHTLGAGNEVTRTIEVTDDGVKETAGGKIGHVPSAPPGWNEQNAEKTSQVWTTGKDNGNGKESATASTPTTTEMAAQGTEEDLTNKECNKARRGQNNNDNDFGAAFQANLRGAFE